MTLNFTTCAIKNMILNLRQTVHFASHGKSHVMELEAVLSIVLPRPAFKLQHGLNILTAPGMFKWAPENIPGMKCLFHLLFLMSAEDVV